MKVLTVSFCFPPVIAPRSIQVARVLRRSVAQHGLVCGVEVGEPLDPTIEPGADASLAAFERIPFARSTLRRKFDAVASRLSLPFVNKVPGRYRSWVGPAVRAADRIVAGGFRPDVVLTFGNPMSDHLIGRRMTRRLGVPWVAHFSDPWIDNPYIMMDRLTYAANRRLVEKVQREAALLLYPSEECADYMLRDADGDIRRKLGVLPHAYAPEPWTPVERRGHILLRHIGSMYGLRTTAPMLKGLALLHERSPSALAALHIDFVGLRDPGLISDAGIPSGVLRVQDRVAYAESVSLMRASDGLIVMDGVWNGPGIFFPSKLADYIGSGTPIFALANPGACQRIVRELGGFVAPLDDPPAIAEELGSFIQFVRDRRRTAAVWGNPEARQQYAADVVARQLDAFLERAASGHRTP